MIFFYHTNGNPSCHVEICPNMADGPAIYNLFKTFTSSISINKGHEKSSFFGGKSSYFPKKAYRKLFTIKQLIAPGPI